MDKTYEAIKSCFAGYISFEEIQAKKAESRRKDLIEIEKGNGDAVQAKNGMFNCHGKYISQPVPKLRPKLCIESRIFTLLPKQPKKQT